MEMEAKSRRTPSLLAKSKLVTDKCLSDASSVTRRNGQNLPWATKDAIGVSLIEAPALEATRTTRYGVTDF